MNPRSLSKVGVGGSLIVALCCFTPVLVIVLGAVGLGVWIAHLDAVLFPLLGVFLIVAAVAWWQLHRQVACCPVPAPGEEASPR